MLLADDHPATRNGIRVALEESGFAVCAEVGDAEQAIQAALRETPDLCLLDIWTTLKHGGCVALVDQDRATQGAYLADLVNGCAAYRWLHMPIARIRRPNVERWYGEISSRPASRASPSALYRSEKWRTD